MPTSLLRWLDFTPSPSASSLWRPARSANPPRLACALILAVGRLCLQVGGQPFPPSGEQAEVLGGAAAAPFPFLRLPAELRKLIYHHLIPNLAISIWSKDVPRPPFRDDGGPCCPAVLRVNRMIHEEALGEWYGFVFYSVGLRGDTMYFLDQTIPPHATPPSTFRAIRSLEIQIPLLNRRRVEQDGEVADLEDSREGVAALARHLSGLDRLQRLRLHLYLTTTWFVGRMGKPDKIRQGLAWNLNPLQGIRGLSEVRTEIVVPSFLRPIMGFSDKFIDGKAEHMAIARAFIDKMEREMLDVPLGYAETPRR